jgi:hypothetical protein
MVWTKGLKVYLAACRNQMHPGFGSACTGWRSQKKVAECGVKVAARRGALVRHVEDSKKVSCMKLPNTCVYKSTLHTSSHPPRRRPHLQTYLPAPAFRTERPILDTTFPCIPAA